MTPTLLDLALKAGFSDPIEGWMGEAYEERLEAFAKLIIEHDAAKRKPLTDEEISNLWCKVSNTDFVTADTHEFARAVEAAHGITGEKA